MFISVFQTYKHTKSRTHQADLSSIAPNHTHIHVYHMYVYIHVYYYTMYVMCLLVDSK